MRQFVAGTESGHDHFFATFGKFGAATGGRTADMLTEARSRAAAGHLQYMELMFNPDGGAASDLGGTLHWNDQEPVEVNLRNLRYQLMNGGLPKIVAGASKSVSSAPPTPEEIFKASPLFNALDTFIRHAADFTSAVEDNKTTYGDDPALIREAIAKVKHRPAAGPAPAC